MMDDINHHLMVAMERLQLLLDRTDWLADSATAQDDANTAILNRLDQLLEMLQPPPADGETKLEKLLRELVTQGQENAAMLQRMDARLAALAERR